VTVEMELTVHSKDACVNEIFHWMAKILMLSSITVKKVLLSSFF